MTRFDSVVLQQKGIDSFAITWRVNPKWWAAITHAILGF